METTQSELIYHSPTVRSWRDEGRFIIPDVVYRGETGTYALFEKMTSALIQNRLIELYEKEKQAGNPVPTDMPLIWSIATRGYELKNESPESTEKLRQFLRTGFRKYPNTLTRIRYSENDAVVHNVGTSDQYHIETEVVGSNGWIRDLEDTRVLEALLGTQDVSQINEVSQWINSTNAYIWRLNSKPGKLYESLARFGAGDYRLFFDYYRDLGYESPAFRIVCL